MRNILYRILNLVDFFKMFLLSVMIGLTHSPLSKDMIMHVRKKDDQYNGKKSQYQRVSTLKIENFNDSQMQPYPILLSPGRSIIQERKKSFEIAGAGISANLFRRLP